MLTLAPSPDPMSSVTWVERKVRGPLDELGRGGSLVRKNDPGACGIPEHAAERAALTIELRDCVVPHPEPRCECGKRVFFRISVQLVVHVVGSVGAEDCG